MLVILVMSLICWKIADAVEHISKYCKLYDMKVNIEKSKYLCYQEDLKCSSFRRMWVLAIGMCVHTNVRCVSYKIRLIIAAVDKPQL